MIPAWFVAMSDALSQELSTHFGFDRFLPGQRKVIEHLLAGKLAAAVFPTGGGKSQCYQLPALMLAGVTLVVSPLIALMKDQMDTLTRRGIAAARLDSARLLCGITSPAFSRAKLTSHPLFGACEHQCFAEVRQRFEMA